MLRHLLTYGNGLLVAVVVVDVVVLAPVVVPAAVDVAEVVVDVDPIRPSATGPRTEQAHRYWYSCPLTTSATRIGPMQDAFFQVVKSVVMHVESSGNSLVAHVSTSIV